MPMQARSRTSNHLLLTSTERIGSARTCTACAQPHTHAQIVLLYDGRIHTHVLQQRADIGCVCGSLACVCMCLSCTHAVRPAKAPARAHPSRSGCSAACGVTPSPRGRASSAAGPSSESLRSSVSGSASESEPRGRGFSVRVGLWLPTSLHGPGVGPRALLQHLGMTLSSSASIVRPPRNIGQRAGAQTSSSASQSGPGGAPGPPSESGAPVRAARALCAGGRTHCDASAAAVEPPGAAWTLRPARRHGHRDSCSSPPGLDPPA